MPRLTECILFCVLYCLSLVTETNKSFENQNFLRRLVSRLHARHFDLNTKSSKRSQTRVRTIQLMHFLKFLIYRDNSFLLSFWTPMKIFLFEMWLLCCCYLHALKTTSIDSGFNYIVAPHTHTHTHAHWHTMATWLRRNGFYEKKKMFSI